MLGVLALVFLVGLGWLVARARLVPRGPVRRRRSSPARRPRCLRSAVVALLVVATNPFALIFLLPSLHAWLWLPQVRRHPIWTRLAVLGAGFLGPVLLLGSFAFRYGLGLDAPWYLAELIATGYVPLAAVAIAVAWLARRRPADGAGRRPLRAVPERTRAAAARAAARDGPPDRAYSESSPAKAGGH